MAIKLDLSSEKILAKVFPSAIRGYDALAVDQFLDEILRDYHKIEANALLTVKEVEELRSIIKALENEKKTLELENDHLKSKLKGIKEGDNVTSDNIQLIKRIHELEKFIYNHGYEPNEIK